MHQLRKLWFLWLHKTFFIFTNHVPLQLSIESFSSFSKKHVDYILHFGKPFGIFLCSYFFGRIFKQKLPQKAYSYFLFREKKRKTEKYPWKTLRYFWKKVKVWKVSSKSVTVLLEKEAKNCKNYFKKMSFVFKLLATVKRFLFLIFIIDKYIWKRVKIWNNRI